MPRTPPLKSWATMACFCTWMAASPWLYESGGGQSESVALQREREQF